MASNENKKYSEARIQSEIKLALCSKDGFAVRVNAGKFWQGERVFSREFNQDVLINIRPVVGLPEGFSDILYIGKGEVAFIEVKNAKGKLRQSQDAFLKRVAELGHKAGVARSVAEAKEIIR